MARPLESFSLYSAVIDQNFEAFKKGLEELLSAPTERLPAALHSVTRSGTTLIGLINQTLDEESAGKQRSLLEQIIEDFQRPFSKSNLKLIRPEDVALKAKNIETHYALCQFTGGEDTNTTALNYALILGAAGAVGAASESLWSEALGLPPLSQQAAAAAAYGPFALSLAGIACRRLFKSVRRRQVIRRLERK